MELLPATGGASPLKKQFQLPLLVLGALVGVVLLIACVNLANLLNGQARVAPTRDGAAGGDWRRPLAPRPADAGRERAARDLRLLGGGSLRLVGGALRRFSFLSSEQEPIRLALGVDWRSTAFGIGLTVLVTVLFGTLPALRASAVAPGDALRSGGRVTSHRRLTHALIGAQAAFCVFVVFVAVLLATTFARLSTHPLGFRADRLLVVNAEAPPSQQGHKRWLAAAEEVRALPGVESVALAAWPLLVGNRWRADVRAAGGPAQPDPAYFLGVSPGFFATMELPLIEGRDLRAGDVSAVGPEARRATASPSSTRPSPATTSTAARRSASASASRSRTACADSFEIVGVVADAAYAALRDPLRPTVYVPADYKGQATLMIRTAGEPDGLAPLVRRIVARARPDSRIRLIASQMDLVRRQLVRERLLATLSVFVAAVAVLLASIGLYGVLHHAVVLEQRPIGIRLALGAGAAHVVREVTASLLAAVALGAGVGLAGGLLFGRVLDGLLFGVATTDVTVLAAPLVVLAAAASAAAFPPALRAVRIDPARTLRAE